METAKTPISIRIIYWMSELAFGLTILAGLFVLAFNILVYTPFFGNDLQLRVELPVRFDVRETGLLEVPGGEVEVELVDATSRIHFINTPMYIARLFGSAMLIAFFFMGYIMFMFRKFIVNVRRQLIFRTSNIEYLRNMAYGLLGLWLFTVIYMRIVHGYFLGALTFGQVVVLHDYRNYPGMLIGALLLWVLSHVFLVGSKMQEEQDLTV